MQDNTEMRRIFEMINPFTDRRINDEVMGCAKAFAAELLRNELATKPKGEPIDSAYIATTSVEIAKAMVATFVEEKLF
jgi:hypothetical protein